MGRIEEFTQVHDCPSKHAVADITMFIPVNLVERYRKKADTRGNHLGYATETSSLVFQTFAILAIRTGFNSNDICTYQLFNLSGTS